MVLGKLGEQVVAVSQKAFDAMMKGRTSFIVAHRLSTIREADLILTMTEGHCAFLRTLFPFAKDKTFSLCAYAGQAGDVADPFGGDVEVYRETRDKLGEILEVLPL